MKKGKTWKMWSNKENEIFRKWTEKYNNDRDLLLSNLDEVLPLLPGRTRASVKGRVYTIKFRRGDGRIKREGWDNDDILKFRRYLSENNCNFVSRYNVPQELLDMFPTRTSLAISKIWSRIENGEFDHIGENQTPSTVQTIQPLPPAPGDGNGTKHTKPTDIFTMMIAERIRVFVRDIVEDGIKKQKSELTAKMEEEHNKVVEENQKLKEHLRKLIAVREAVENYQKFL